MVSKYLEWIAENDRFYQTSRFTPDRQSWSDINDLQKSYSHERLRWLVSYRLHFSANTVAVDSSKTIEFVTKAGRRG